jgi:hypothetical protein
MLTIRQVLAMDTFAQASVVAGVKGLDREARWAHPVDIPQASEWVREGELLLTTLYGYRDDPGAQANLCATLATKGLAGMVVAVGGVGGYLDHAPTAMRQAADAADFPLIELPWNVPFEDVVRAVSERIINEQYELYKQSLAIHRTLTRLVLDGGSLQDVAHELCHLLNRAVEIDDLSFTALAIANTEESEIDEIRRNAIQTGRRSLDLRLRLDHRQRTRPGAARLPRHRTCRHRRRADPLPRSDGSPGGGARREPRDQPPAHRRRAAGQHAARGGGALPPAPRSAPRRDRGGPWRQRDTDRRDGGAHERPPGRQRGGGG